MNTAKLEKELNIVLSEDAKKRLDNCTSLDDILDEEYGKIGTEKRDIFESNAGAFCISERLRQERINAGLTQQQLADRIGAKKSYISRIENGKTDIQLSTLFRLFHGLGKKVKLTILP
jgi:HTH-type transcriptional regulator/antitoxin HipB